jgi:hypothetical protein
LSAVEPERAIAISRAITEIKPAEWTWYWVFEVLVESQY